MISSAIASGLHALFDSVILTFVCAGNLLIAKCLLWWDFKYLRPLQFLLLGELPPSSNYLGNLGLLDSCGRSKIRLAFEPF